MSHAVAEHLAVIVLTSMLGLKLANIFTYKLLLTGRNMAAGWFNGEVALKRERQVLNTHIGFQGRVHV